MSNMNTPRTRAEFERNFNLLQRKIKDGHFFIQEGLTHSISGLTKVRFLPNGRTDFLSVDESARLQANMMNQITKKSLQEELKEYQENPDVPTTSNSKDPLTHDS